MSDNDNTVLNLISGFKKKRELEKQKKIWRVFGVDYEAEKAKQEAIWAALQKKQKKKKRKRKKPKKKRVSQK